jgi:hypothetical protein
MPLFSVVITQVSVITVEAPDAAAVEAGLDNPETLGELVETLEDPSNWETTCEVKEPAAGAHAEYKAEGGKFTVYEAPLEPSSRPTVRRKK